MQHDLTFPQQPGLPLGKPEILLLILFLASLLYFYNLRSLEKAPAAVYATGTVASGLTFAYEISTADLEIDWAASGDFDPWGKCPQDFFEDGFILLCKKLADGAYFKFLLHRGKGLLYRIDQDVIGGKALIGLHWVEGTHFGAKYRIADSAFKGGQTVLAPNAKGGTDALPFHYGEAVSKKRSQPGRELYRATHIKPGQCPEWWDFFHFIP